MTMDPSQLKECLPLIERKSDVAELISKIKQDDFLFIIQLEIA